MDQLQGALVDMHRDFVVRLNMKRRAAVKSHNRGTGVRPVNFTERDYVLRGLLLREKEQKPGLRWKGPYRVTACLSGYGFQIEHLLTGMLEDADGRWLTFFRNQSFEVTEEVRDHLAYQENEMTVIEKFKEIRRR